MKIIKLAVLSIFLLFTATQTWALPINANNLDLTELQTAFTKAGSNIDVNTDETQSELFAFQSPSASAVYIASISFSDPSILEFGLYDPFETTNQLTLFDSATIGDNTDISFTFANNLCYSSYDTVTYDSSGIPQITTTIVDLTYLTSNVFGFYISSSSFGTYYSQSAINDDDFIDLDGDGTNDTDHFLTYMGQGDNVTWPSISGANDTAHWYVAAEATPIDGDSDGFTDFVVQFESIQPVPEPGTLVLFGFGLLGLAGICSRRKKITKN